MKKTTHSCGQKFKTTFENPMQLLWLIIRCLTLDVTRDLLSHKLLTVYGKHYNCCDSPSLFHGTSNLVSVHCTVVLSELFQVNFPF